MIVNCWGARGSIAVSGPEFNRYGGDTTCMEILPDGGGTIILDAGTGIRRLGKSMLRDKRFACDILFTHAHWDHLLGFPFFDLIYHEAARIAIYACPMAKGDLPTLLARTMAPPFYPVPFKTLAAAFSHHGDCLSGREFTLQGVEIGTIPLSHPNTGQGFRLTQNGRSFVFLTDNELGYIHPGGREFDEYVRFCEGADLLVHDAEYTPAEYAQTRGWGHSTCLDAARLAHKAGVGRLGLFHHNRDRSDQEVEAMTLECTGYLASRDSGVECFAMSQNTSIRL